MKWKLYFSSNGVDRKHQILFRRDFGVNPSKPDITKDLKYKFFTKGGAFSYAATIEQWIPATNSIVIEYDGKTLPTYNYMYAVALDDNGNPLPYDYCFFVTDYDVVSAGAIRFYLEPDDFQNYFNLQITGTIPNHYITGTCIQTNSQTILNGSDRYRILDPKPVGGDNVINVFTKRTYILIVLYKAQTGITIGTLAGETPTGSQITKFNAVTLDVAISKLNEIAASTKTQIWKWTGSVYEKQGEENIEVYDAYILPSEMFNLENTTITPQLFYDKIGGLDGLEVVNFSFPINEQNITVSVPTSVNLDLSMCSLGTNKHRFEFNPLNPSITCKLTAQVGQGQLKIQLSFNGNVCDIEDDFEAPVIFSSAAQQYAQQSIFRAINAVKGGIGVAKDIAEMKPVNAVTGAISIAESFIPPQSTMQVEGTANGILNLKKCNGLGVFYYNSINEMAQIGYIANYGYNVCELASFNNEVLSTDSTAETWYKFNNAQFITQYVPIAKRQAIEQMFNDGIFITKVYNDT